MHKMQKILAPKMRDQSTVVPSSEARCGSAPLRRVPPEPDPLLVALARICRTAREQIGRKQVHIAASIDVDQSTIARFERAGGWPRNVSRVIDAYAEELGVDPWDLWQQALMEGRNGTN